VEVHHPATFEIVYLLDGLSFLLYAPFLLIAQDRPLVAPAVGAQRRPTYRDVLRDKTFLRVWALTASVATVSYGMCNSAFPAFATRPGGITASGLGLAFAANTLTVVGAQLLVLRLLQGRRRTSAVALAAGAWAVTWAIVLASDRLGGLAAQMGFASAMVVFALGECLLSPTLPAVINDLATPEDRGRYNGLGTLAWTTGFIAGPALAGLALARGWGPWLFITLILACGLVATAALRLGRGLSPAIDTVDAGN
jgi:MFS family permease